MWSNLNENDRKEYRKMILAFTSLTEMFDQKGVQDKKPAPILNSKYQETVFQKVFNASAEDIGNSAYDASLIVQIGEIKHKYLVGIKTFGIKSGYQKIAQFKSSHSDWAGTISKIEENARDKTSKEEINCINNDLYKALAKEIARLRNLRIDSAKAKINGFEISADDSLEAVYHVLMPSDSGDNPKITVGEIDYSPIDVDNINIKGCTTPKNPTNFNFDDGKHSYRFTSADSQLLMDFKNSEIEKEVWDVKYADNAYQIFYDIANKVIEQENNIIAESYTWPIKIEKYSGFNSFYGTGSKLGLKDRETSIESVKSKYTNIIEAKVLQDVIQHLKVFLIDLQGNSNEIQIQKENVRNEIIKILSTIDNIDFCNRINNLIWRPVNELYIPIPDSANFHNNHPDFFCKNAGHYVGTKTLKENSQFKLIFEPSGETIDCFITQDNGKAIQSLNKQSILGKWLLRDVFQLNEHEPLTQKRLEELGINHMKLFKKTGETNIVHLEFIYKEED